MIWIIIAVVVVVVIVAVVYAASRGSRQEPGVASFRRHIDALSPEARREVMDRVRKPEPTEPPDDQQETGD